LYKWDSIDNDDDNNNDDDDDDNDENDDDGIAVNEDDNFSLDCTAKSSTYISKPTA
jgi:hypothetical protein